MFWRLPFRPTSSIDSVLSKEDVSFYMVLDDEDIIQEGKTQNPKLSEFISGSDILPQLVSLITNQTFDNVDEKIRFKYPNIACELLTSDMGTISANLMSHHFDNLTGFLENEPPLNPLYASFNCKVLIFLCRNIPNDFLSLIKISNTFLDNLMKHIGTSSCMDLLLQLVTTGQNHNPEFSYWLNERHFVNSLILLISAKSPRDVCYNVSQLLIEMLRLEKETAIDSNVNSDLILSLESEDSVDQLFTNILQITDGPSISICMQCGISVLQYLLEPYRSNDQLICPDLSLPIRFENCILGLNSSPLEKFSTRDLKLSLGGKNVLKLIPQYINQFEAILSETPKFNSDGIQVLGYRRLTVIKLLTTIIQISPPESHHKFLNTGLIKTLFDLFICHPWNNFLHTQVYNMLIAFLFPCNKNTGNDASNPLLGVNPDSENSSILAVSFKLLLENGQIIEKILECWDTNRNFQVIKSRRMGYMGHLTMITNRISDLINSDIHFSSIFTNYLRPDLIKNWEKLCNEELNELNFRNNSKMGGITPIPNFSPEELMSDSSLSQGYTEYQLHTLASNFDEFISIDDENNFDDQIDNPYTNLDCIDFTVNPEEDRDVLEAYMQMCNEYIDHFNEVVKFNETMDSNMSRESEDWMTHNADTGQGVFDNNFNIPDVDSEDSDDDIDDVNDYQDNVRDQFDDVDPDDVNEARDIHDDDEDHDDDGIDDDDPDDDDDEDQMDNDRGDQNKNIYLMPEKIFPSTGGSNDIIETHIIYSQSMGTSNLVKPPIKFEAKLFDDKDLDSQQLEIHHIGATWPLEDGNEGNSWAEFGSFTDICSNDSRIEYRCTPDKVEIQNSDILKSDLKQNEIPSQIPPDSEIIQTSDISENKSAFVTLFQKDSSNAEHNYVDINKMDNVLFTPQITPETNPLDDRKTEKMDTVNKLDDCSSDEFPKSSIEVINFNNRNNKTAFDNFFVNLESPFNNEIGNYLFLNSLGLLREESYHNAFFGQTNQKEIVGTLSTIDHTTRLENLYHPS